MKRSAFFLAFCLAFFSTTNAQHEHHMKMDTDSSQKATEEMSMSHAFSRYLPMTRNGSGTAWLPDASPMYGKMLHSGGWMFMMHGNLFLRYTNQDFTNKGSRGGREFDAPNWFMLMGQKKVGQRGLFHFNTMLSLDALIGGGSGYPLLFQSGEAYKGKAIVDRQHPHDLFSELSVSYAYALSPKADLFAYLGYSGEPALGPVAFMHRPSALDNPDAPLSHHWADATHITFGVATIGARLGKVKIEQSLFTGREPDDRRYGFDKPRFDSWSGRLSYNPSANWSLQVSKAYVKSPEVLHGNEDVKRTTASVVYSRQTSSKSTFNATALWGMNKSAGHDRENAFLLEASQRWKRLALHTRYEYVQKSNEELDINPINGKHIFPVNAFTLGFNYDLMQGSTVRVAGGAQGSIYHAEPSLNSLYGKNPMAFEVYIRIYPTLMRM